MSREMRKGDRVYDAIGREYDYVEQCAAGHVVEPVMLWDDDETTGDPVVLPDVRPSAPQPKLYAEVVRLRDRADAIRREIVETEAEAAKLRAEREVLEREHEAVARIRDFLAGRITHVVTYGYSSLEIQEIAKAATDGYDVRLLALFGRHRDNQRVIEWSLNQYRDGSGSNWYRVIPCCSREEALAAARAEIERCAASKNSAERWRAAMWAEKFGVPVRPAILREKAKQEADRAAQEAALARKNYETAQAAADKAQAKLDGIQGGADA